MKRLTYKQHVETGAQLKQANQAINAAFLTILNYGGKSSRASRLARKLSEQIGALRCEMDSRVFQEHGERSTEELKHIYYGPQST